MSTTKAKAKAPTMGRPRSGSAYQRGDRWYVQVTLPTGRRATMRQPVGTTEEEARATASTLAKQIASGKIVDDRPSVRPRTIGAMLDAWLAIVDARDLAPATVAGHRTASTRIRAAFGTKAPADLTPPVLRAWLRALREDVSASRTRNVFWSLAKFLDDAEAEGWHTSPNPCRSTKVQEELPAVGERDDEDKARHTEAEASKLLASVRLHAPDRFVRYVLAYTSGMREGELAGLRWSSIVAEHDIPALKVKDQIARYGDEGWATRRATKTKAGRRTIPLHPAAVAALDAWRESGWRTFVGRAPTDADPILPSPEGAAWRPRSSDLLREDLATVGLPATWGEDAEPFAMRSTRRSFATFLEAHDVSGDHADRLLGHAGASVRRRHYSAGDLVALARAVATIRLEPPTLPSPDVPGGGSFRGPTNGRILPDPPRALPRQAGASPRSLRGGGARLEGDPTTLLVASG